MSALRLARHERGTRPWSRCVLPKAKETCNGARLPEEQSRKEKAQSRKTQARGTNVTIRAWSRHERREASCPEEGPVVLPNRRTCSNDMRCQWRNTSSRSVSLSTTSLDD